MNYSTIIAAAAIALTAPAANAAVVTFGSSPGNGTAQLGNGTVYSEAGLTFTSDAGGELLTWQNGNGYNPSGNSALFQNFVGTGVTITATAGGSFYLNGFDLADVFNNGAAGPIAVSWTTAAAEFGNSLVLNNTPGFQTYTLNLANLTSFSLIQNEPYFQLDNVRFNEASAAVPEPATWAMMLFGFGAMGFAMRRKSAVTARVRYA